MRIVEKQIGNFDRTEFDKLCEEIDKTLKNKDNKNKMIVLEENDYKEIGKRTTVILHLREYYNLSNKQLSNESEIGIKSIKKSD